MSTDTAAAAPEGVGEIDAGDDSSSDRKSAALATLEENPIGTPPKTPEPDDEPDEGGDEEAEPEEKRQTNAFRALQRQRLKVKAERDALVRDREAFERERHTSAGDREAAAQLRRLRELSASDRHALLEELGVTYEDLTKEMLERGTPDEKTTKLEKELRELRREREAEAKKSEEAAEHARRVQDRAKAVADVQALVTSEETKASYPHANDLTPRELMARVDEMADAMRADGGGFTLPALMANVEKRERRIYERAVARYKAGLTAAPPPAPEAARPTKTKGKPGRTLSSRDVSDAATEEADDLSWESRKRKAMAAAGV